jgi:hypothetical protein
MEESMVVALSGRRIDAPNASRPAFPLGNVDVVRERILRALSELHATILVCSAACGADLLALEAAETLGARRRIVLPFDAPVFRETSVVDRPGDWGPPFDRCVLAATASNDLVNLGFPQADESYARTNAFLLEESQRLASASQDRVTAMRVWDGVAKAQGDHTEWLGKAARERRLDVFDVWTL